MARRTPRTCSPSRCSRDQAGALYGRSDPGGTINILTKQPVALPFVEMGTLFGSFGTARTTVDAGGPLNEEGTVLYRFNGALARQDSFRDFVDGDRVLAAPVVSGRSARTPS